MITAQAETFLLRNPFTISRGSKTEARVVTARITRNGHRGWGEGLPYPRYGETVEDAIAAILALPEGITAWIKMRVSQMYEYREPMQAGNMTELPRSFVDGLLDPYVLIDVRP